MDGALPAPAPSQVSGERVRRSPEGLAVLLSRNGSRGGVATVAKESEPPAFVRQERVMGHRSRSLAEGERALVEAGDYVADEEAERRLVVSLRVPGPRPATLPALGPAHLIRCPSRLATRHSDWVAGETLKGDGVVLRPTNEAISLSSATSLPTQTSTSTGVGRPSATPRSVPSTWVDEAQLSSVSLSRRTAESRVCAVPRR